MGYVDENGLAVIASSFAKKTTGTSSAAGLTKLYTSTGQSEDGTMTQKAISDALTTLGESVADGKASIASAITNKGVTTSSTASFNDMANNIEQIESGVNTDFRIIDCYVYENVFTNCIYYNSDEEIVYDENIEILEVN